MMNHFSATATAPATVANVAVGFDILGFAVEGLADVVKVQKVPEKGCVIKRISGKIAHLDQIPLEPEKNCATVGILQMLKDFSVDFGLAIEIEKQIPLGSGLGGSAASSVAGVVAASALIDSLLTREQMLQYAMMGEELASKSRHADNVAPCLMGGLVFCRSTEPFELYPLPIPQGLFCVLAHSQIVIKTSEARAMLQKTVSLEQMIKQTTNLSGFILGCVQSDFQLLRKSLRDEVIEPQRAHLIPSFAKVQKAAMDAGALGCSISGAGPAIFALAQGESAANRICDHMTRAFREADIQDVRLWISPVSTRGTQVAVY